mmetsp:Transcript_2083/g.5245  ORF Transcript_2083/g.5245 Transcript_2083/m.5245 type:complete len:209 (-) Transcript_2083:195-821(-)
MSPHRAPRRCPRTSALPRTPLCRRRGKSEYRSTDSSRAHLQLPGPRSNCSPCDGPKPCWMVLPLASVLTSATARAMEEPPRRLSCTGRSSRTCLGRSRRNARTDSPRKCRPPRPKHRRKTSCFENSILRSSFLSNRLRAPCSRWRSKTPSHLASCTAPMTMAPVRSSLAPLPATGLRPRQCRGGRSCLPSSRRTGRSSQRCLGTPHRK